MSTSSAEKRKADRHSPGYMRDYMRDWQRRKRAEKKNAQTPKKDVDSHV